MYARACAVSYQAALMRIQSIQVSKDMVAAAKNAIRAFGVRVVVAPYEADAQVSSVTKKMRCEDQAVKLEPSWF